MNKTTQKSSLPEQPARRSRSWISMRMVITVASVVLVSASVIGVGGMGERTVRRVLSNELETRLVLEARNLAMISAGAFLSEFPELTLVPYIKEMESERSDLAKILVVDHEGVILGCADANQLRQPFIRDEGLEPVDSAVGLVDGEALLWNQDVIVVETPIRHPNGETIGRSVIELERSYIDGLVTDARRNQVVVLLAVLVAALILTPILMSWLLRPMGMLHSGLERIGKGDLDVRLRRSSLTELGLLASSVNNMAARLKAAQVELVEKERLDHEMELAREIQRSLLADERQEIGDFLVTGAQKAAEEVGGDYYDVIVLEDGRVGLLIADVAGKGLAGCLVTSMIAVLIRTLGPSHSSPAALLVALEDALAGSLQPGTFVTMFYGLLDTKTGVLTYASAGHNPVLHYQASTQTVQRHDTRGIPMGLIPGEALRDSLADNTLKIETGDVLVQYTDGFHEAVNPSGEEFGIERMAELIGNEAVDGNDSVSAGLQMAIDRWEGTLPAADDKTLLVVSRMSSLARDAAANARSRSEMVAQLWEKRHGSSHHFSLNATFEALDGIGVWLRRCAFLKELPQPELDLIEQGLYEVTANIVEHGCSFEQSEVIDVWWVPDQPDNAADDAWPGRGSFLVRDHGTPPMTQDMSIPNLNSSRVRKEGRGLGLRMIHQTFEEVEMHPKTKVGNLTVLKFRAAQAQPA